MVQVPSGWGLDERFSLKSNEDPSTPWFYVFADDNGDTAEFTGTSAEIFLISPSLLKATEESYDAKEPVYLYTH